MMMDGDDDNIRDIGLTTTLLQLVCRYLTTCAFLSVYTVHSGENLRIRKVIIKQWKHVS